MNVDSNFKHYLLVEEYLSENTIKAYLSDVKAFLDFVKIKKYDIKSEDTVISYIKNLIKKSYSIESILRKISSISVYYDYLIKEKVIDKNPVLLIDKPKKWFKLPDFLNEDEILKILDTVDKSTPHGFRDYIIINMLYTSGMRISELVNIEVSNCDFRRGIIRIKGKGGKERFVPIHKKLIEELNKYLEIRHNYFVKGRDNGYLFLNKFGNKLSREYCWKIVRKYAEMAGIKKKVSPHVFRHTFATHLLKNGADLRVIQMLLGHSSILTTEIYTQLDDDSLRNSLSIHHPRFKR
ncbi:site-specific DNA tyrosine recombinase XerD [Deferribacter desulfuricans SSM1]|uniref:Site-specific DNA tyrosine recombinase XerD n=1 Tax=Deferribacter desulfuricans (strain DSM 14783 / JCM 11476 / NBRC 101012 / SSM1) TaxID=639282 RepID=D3PD72_DEFDS|nr:site-specific tyrosine recombinase/integron integrase [Deferribacter desulfuricans]BAI80545.1 site-specific DNA tyrosine recombinase XerD [Deferribacter desulfuricans SSM1]